MIQISSTNVHVVHPTACLCKLAFTYRAFSRARCASNTESMSTLSVHSDGFAASVRAYTLEYYDFKYLG